MIGWYHSGPKLRTSDLEINELFKRYTPNPVLVIVDVKPKDIGIPTDAYFAVEEIKEVMIKPQCAQGNDCLRHHSSAFVFSSGRHGDCEDLHACTVRD